MKAWLVQLWALIKARSKTLAGALLVGLGLLVDHVEEVKSALAGYGVAGWKVTAAGIVLVVVGRVAVEMRDRTERV